MKRLVLFALFLILVSSGNAEDDTRTIQVLDVLPDKKPTPQN